MITYRNLMNAVVLFFLSILMLTWPVASNASDAYFQLEITNIKPAGTGNPAIPASHRIFRAYPGIEYNIRAAVIGGVYPYKYQLSNSPTGMTINSATGEISWPNPQSNSGTITLTVTDSENTKLTTSWSITVTTNGFIFVDASYSGQETGSISQPFRSIYNLLNSTFNGDNSRIVYFRKGNYILPAWNSSSTSRIASITGKAGTNINQNPATWLGYPGEPVNIDGDGRFIFAAFSRVYFDKLNLSNFSDYGMLLGSSNNYMTIRRCHWNKVTAVDTVNENQGFLFLSRTGFGDYFVVQDNVFTNFTGASAIGSLYDHRKILIENNDIYNSGGGGINGLNHPLMPKEYLTFTTIRGNRVVVNTGLILNARLYGSDFTEITHNLFYRQLGSSSRATAFETNTEGHIANGRTKGVRFWRNTVTQDVYFRFIDPNNCGLSGPYDFYQNIILNPNQNAPEYSYETYNYLSFNNDGGLSPADRQRRRSCINDYNNLFHNSVSSVIDSNGILTSNYQSYLGKVGWQFADGSTPMDGAYTPEPIGPVTEVPGAPKNLSVN